MQELLYVYRHNRQEGPYTPHKLQQLIRCGIWRFYFKKSKRACNTYRPG